MVNVLVKSAPWRRTGNLVTRHDFSFLACWPFLLWKVNFFTDGQKVLSRVIVFIICVHFWPTIIHAQRPNFSRGPTSRVTHSFNLRFPAASNLIHPHSIMIKSRKIRCTWSRWFCKRVTSLELFTNAQKRKCRVPGQIFILLRQVPSNSWLLAVVVA